MVQFPKSQAEWRAAIGTLPSTPDNIPAFFFTHGSPFLAFPKDSPAFAPGRMSPAVGPNGLLAKFLQDFGPALLEKYKPKGIVVFSAHWETDGERLVTDYGNENPLLFDYYGFDPQLYKLRFKSRGDPALSRRVIELFQKANHPARLTPPTEPRGSDGRGYMAPGLDHGVFIPFRIMFPDSTQTLPPIVQVSLDGDLKPESNWAVGRALAQLRREGILILSGGMTVHNLRNRTTMAEDTAPEACKAFDLAVMDALAVEEPSARKAALFALPSHPGFNTAHPRAEHFVPLYVAAGAGDVDPSSGDVISEKGSSGRTAQLLAAMYGSPTIAFGL